VSQKLPEADDIDPTDSDPGAEAGDDGDFVVEDPMLGHTGKLVNQTDLPTLLNDRAGSYGHNGTYTTRLFDKEPAPEGFKIAAKNVTGYIVPAPKLPDPAGNGGKDAFQFEIDDIANVHDSFSPYQKKVWGTEDTDVEYTDADRYPVYGWKSSNNGGDAAPGSQDLSQAEKSKDVVLDYLTKL